MAKDDGLRRLPDHVVAPLLRALMTIPRRPEARLILRRSDRGRPPLWDPQNDYNVVWRGQNVGRVFLHSGADEPERWCWTFSDVHDRRTVHGYTPSLKDATLAFRAAWDAAPKSDTAG